MDCVRDGSLTRQPKKEKGNLSSGNTIFQGKRNITKQEKNELIKDNTWLKKLSCTFFFLKLQH